MFLTISLSSWLSMSLSTPLTIALAKWLSRGLSPQLARTHPQNPFACVRSFDLFRAYRQNISSFNYPLVWRGPYVDMWTRIRIHIKKNIPVLAGGDPTISKTFYLLVGRLSTLTDLSKNIINSAQYIWQYYQHCAEHNSTMKSP